jgi:hypothetical protein
MLPSQEARMNINFNVKTKIRYNGQEYSDPNQLPPEVRAAYEKALRKGADLAAARKIVFNGQEFANEDEMPRDERKAYDGIMGVIQGKDQVTLPSAQRSEGLLTKGQIKFILFLIGLLAVFILLVITKTIG